MNRTSVLLAVIALSTPLVPLSAEMGVALISGTSSGSTIKGAVTFVESAEGLKISGNLEGVPPGNHGFHIHEFGSCEDLGKAAGNHFNPLDKPHGEVHKAGVTKVHAGDLGNITVGEDGKGRVDTVIKGLKLTDGTYTVAGRAVVIHEKNDDFSQPLGNAGGRIGCGPIIVTGK